MAEQNFSRKLRLLVDARRLGEHGIGVYCDNLISALSNVSWIDLSVIVNSGVASRYPWANKVEVLEDAAKPYSFDEYFNLTKRIKFSNYDLFHEPHYTLPFGIEIPTVVTIHDLIQVQYPQRWFYPFVVKLLISSAMKRATRIIAVSHATAKELARFQERFKDKISVVPNFINSTMLQSIRAAPVRVSDCNYLLAVFSTLKPHKALEDLLKAFKVAQERQRKQGTNTQRPLRLVLAGSGFETISEEQLALIKNTKDVILAGRLERAELNSLFAGASALVVPSLAEGFCLPALEAKYFGIPVVCRPVAALNEFLDTYDYVADDFSVESLAGAICKSLNPTRNVAKSCSTFFSSFSEQSFLTGILAVYLKVLGHQNWKVDDASKSGAAAA